jgi:hypothetical protein
MDDATFIKALKIQKIAKGIAMVIVRGSNTEAS